MRNGNARGTERRLNSLQGWGRWAVVLLAVTVDARAACRSAALDLTTHDMSLELGAYGTLFREASLPECRTTVRDQLLRKLRLSLDDPPRLDQVLGRDVRTFERWLAGANVGLAVPTAMQLGGAGLLDPVLDQAIRATIEAYRFNIDPACGTNLLNECMDDLTQAAAAYAWSAAYEQLSDRSDRAARFATLARGAMRDALAMQHHVCMTPLDFMPHVCGAIAEGYSEIVTFNHGFENVAYGIGLMTSLSSAAVALDTAGIPYVASDAERLVAMSLFREGQKRALPDGTAFRSDCYQLAGNTLVMNSPCADADYLPRMFPVRTFYERAFHNPPNEEPFRFDQLDATLFRTPFMNDGRYAVYAELGERWWRLRPRLDGYHGALVRRRAVR